MNLSNQARRELELYGWDKHADGRVCCDCVANHVHGEDCKCYQEYLVALHNGELSQPDDVKVEGDEVYLIA